MENFNPQPEIERRDEGRWLKEKLYELLRDGYYDFPKLQDSEPWDSELDINDPRFKSIRADYINDEDVYVYLAGAATPELADMVGISSRNSIQLRWPKHFDDSGHAMILDSITVYIDEGSNFIGDIVRRVSPAPRYRAMAKGHNRDIDSPQFIKEITEIYDLESKLDDNTPLSREEFEFIKEVLSGLNSSHQVEPSHLRFFGGS